MRINSRDQIKIGAILSYLSIGINIIAGLLYTPWMVDTIGKSDYGLYTLANSLITLFLVDFGLSSLQIFSMLFCFSPDVPLKFRLFKV